MTTQKTQKNFKGISEETVRFIEKFAEEGSMGHGEFLEELVNVYRKKRISDEANGTIPNALRLQFKSDVQKIEQFIKAIQTLFINQMESISAERTTWEGEKEKELEIKNAIIEKMAIEVRTSEDALVLERKEIENKNELILEYEKQFNEFQDKVVGKERLIESLEDNIKHLETQNEEREQQLKKLTMQLEERTKELSKLSTVSNKYDKLKVELQEMEKAHQNEINLIKQKYDIEIERALIEKVSVLNDSFSNKIEKAKQESFDKAYELVEKRYLREIEVLKENHTKEISNFENQRNKQLEKD